MRVGDLQRDLDEDLNGNLNGEIGIYVICILKYRKV
jgi:hypothetical protein